VDYGGRIGRNRKPSALSLENFSEQNQSECHVRILWILHCRQLDYMIKHRPAPVVNSELAAALKLTRNGFASPRPITPLYKFIRDRVSDLAVTTAFHFVVEGTEKFPVSSRQNQFIITSPTIGGCGLCRRRRSLNSSTLLPGQSPGPCVILFHRNFFDPAYRTLHNRNIFP
jgi:hypothetical protein